MKRPANNFGFTIEPSKFARENLYFTNAMGWLHSNPDFIIDRDNFYYYLIMYGISGKLHIEQYGKSSCLKAGEVILMDLSVKHKYYSDKISPCEILWIHFAGSESTKLSDIIIDEKEQILTSTNDIIPKIIRKNFSIVKNKENNMELKISDNIYSLLLELLSIKCKDITNISQNKIIKNIDNFIEANLDQTIRLDNLAKQVQLSKYYFSRLFKEMTGKSPLKYVTDYKLKKSKYMLLYTNKMITRIAEELGFTDQSHFSRTFKKAEGLSPTEFRNNVQM